MRLSQAQLENLIQDTSLDFKKQNLYGRCPKCGQCEFGISLADNHLFNCFRKKQCGFVGNIYTLLKFLNRTKEFLSDREINIFEKLESKLGEQISTLDLDLPQINPPPLWKRIYDDPYLRSRGFVDYQFQKFEVGRSVTKKDYITFLVRMNGVLTGYISRSERDKEWIDQQNKNGNLYLRYNNSATDFSKMLFGYDEIVKEITTDVILVEGIFSKTKTDVNLKLDLKDEVKCCATFGAKLSDHQIKLLKDKGIKRLWFWFEADVLDKIKHIVSRAALDFDVMVSYLYGLNQNDIDSEQAFEFIDNSKSWMEFNMSYIKSNLHV